MNFISKIITILLLIISIYSCDDTKSTIPTVYVDITIDLNDPLYNDLTIPGGYEYITGGYQGIIVYHSALDDNYIAFDRACSFDPECGKLYVKEPGFFVIDSICCKSEFSLLTGGTPTKESKATYPLKQYKCIYNNDAKILQIKN